MFDRSVHRCSGLVGRFLARLRNRAICAVLFVCACVYLPSEPALAGSCENKDSPPLLSLTPEAIRLALRGPGLSGRVHGRLQEDSFAVLSLRTPEDFFNSLQINLVPVPGDENLLAQLKSLERHDSICIKGDLAVFGGDQLHAFVTRLFIEDEWQKDYPQLPEYQYRAPRIESLPTRGIVRVIVHAVSEGLLVAEYGDRIVPLVVKGGGLPQGLFRGDLIAAAYVMSLAPDRPPHLYLDTTAAWPVRILKSAQREHGKILALEGQLALFPRSPQISRDIFALYFVDDGFDRNYTLVNFADPILFENIQSSLAEVWSQYEEDVVRGRNSFRNPRIRLKVRGVGHVVSPNQANPQLLVEKLEDIEIRILEN